MARVVWTDEASEQIDLIVAYIELFDVTAAARMGLRLRDSAASLKDFPNRGRPVKDGTRELVTVPPYILRYDVLDEIVLIVGVRHGARQSD